MLRAVKTLDHKLHAIREGAYRPEDFIIADAKDADMGKGVAAGGPASTGFKTRRAYLDDMAAVVRQAEVDIVLTSPANGEQLVAERVFDRSSVTLAVRANDTTDVWLARGSSYAGEPSRPFRTASLELVRPFCDLGLYSITFNNSVAHDHASLEAYGRFREEARRAGLRHFLEIFNPNAPSGLAPEAIGSFVNDSVIRALAGVVSAERPLFLKMAYNGPRALEELAGHDPSLVVGILGGTAGTTRDCYELLHQGSRHGARVALFGRKIQLAESPLDIIALMRPVLRGDLSPVEAVRAYHAALAKRGVKPARSLEDDSAITETVLGQG